MEQSKRIKEEDVPSKLIFEMYGMTDNSKSKKFAESSSWLAPEIANALLEQGIIQRVGTGDDEKYALTFKGIARCIQIKYGKTLEEQFLNFLELSDRKFNTVEQTKLLWNEKLASMSLILLASISPSSAIRLNNEGNKAVLTEVFQKVLTCMKGFGMIEKEQELKTVDRGESPVSALMSRLNTLARKTNNYYKFIGKGSEYYMDIEKNGGVDEKRLFFLLRRIFEQYDSTCNYEEMYKELVAISQLYYPRFLSRTVNPTVVLTILQKLKDFVDREVLHLPPRIPQCLEHT
jgi:hypothetical protein